MIMFEEFYLHISIKPKKKKTRYRALNNFVCETWKILTNHHIT